MECKVVSGYDIQGNAIRINRNIVECKETLLERIYDAGPGINRNIVECKDDSGIPVLGYVKY